jgi:hypothetical protein
LAQIGNVSPTGGVGGVEGVTPSPPVVGSFYYFSYLNGRKIKIQKGPADSSKKYRIK